MDDRDPESRLALSFSLGNLTAPLQPYDPCKRPPPSIEPDGLGAVALTVGSVPRRIVPKLREFN